MVKATLKYCQKLYNKPIGGRGTTYLRVS